MAAFSPFEDFNHIVLIRSIPKVQFKPTKRNRNCNCVRLRMEVEITLFRFPAKNSSLSFCSSVIIITQQFFSVKFFSNLFNFKIDFLNTSLDQRHITTHSKCTGLLTRRQYDQCDQIGFFWNFLGTNFIYKSSPNVWIPFWVVLKTITFSVKLVGYFSGNFCKNLGYFLFQH